MHALGVPLALRVGITWFYEKVLCRIKQSQGLDIFHSNTRVKQGCPLSPTLFGICTHKLKELIYEFAAAKRIQGPKLGLWTILLLLYADDVVLFAYNPDSMHKLLPVLFKTFCQEGGLQVNVTKTKMMAVCTIQPKHPPNITF